MKRTDYPMRASKQGTRLSPRERQELMERWENYADISGHDIVPITLRYRQERIGKPVLTDTDHGVLSSDEE
ncbi:MAG: hypothetical protein M1330_04825 [Armatimonadetes bacterium]|nr:hypothetical protein [Armatimonadota bacterium]